MRTLLALAALLLLLAPAATALPMPELPKTPPVQLPETGDPTIDGYLNELEDSLNDARPQSLPKGDCVETYIRDIAATAIPETDWGTNEDGNFFIMVKHLTKAYMMVVYDTCLEGGLGD